jgi:hypothetical protein
LTLDATYGRSSLDALDALDALDLDALDAQMDALDALDVKEGSDWLGIWQRIRLGSRVTD